MTSTPLPSRRATGPVRYALTDAARLAAEPEAWDDLVARAVMPHPHYSRHVIEAHRRHGLAPRDLGAVAVRQDGRLTALLPYTLGLDLTGFGRRVASPFTSPYMTATAPLVASDAASPETFAALVEGLRVASGGRAWRWPLLSVRSPSGEGLLQAMRADGWAVGAVEAFERPVLDRRPSHDVFASGHPHGGRLKDLRRRRRRLSEAGTLTLDTACDGPALASAVEDFLALEAAGWKGAAGTALRCRPATEAFARDLFGSGVGPVAVRADVLRLDGRPLAASLALVAGGTACLLKTAFDEAQRAHAPGLVLEAEIVRALHADAFAERLDSATLPGSALEGLYRDRETIAEIVAVPPGGMAALDRRLRLARFEHRARAEAKRLLGRR